MYIFYNFFIHSAGMPKSDILSHQNSDKMSHPVTLSHVWRLPTPHFLRRN